MSKYLPLWLIVFISACGGPTVTWKPGDIYSIKGSNNDGYYVLKVLEVEKSAVWYGLYVDKSDNRPTAANLSGLRKWVVSWSFPWKMKDDEPILITRATTTPEEMEMLRISKENYKNDDRRW